MNVHEFVTIVLPQSCVKNPVNAHERVGASPPVGANGCSAARVHGDRLRCDGDEHALAEGRTDAGGVLEPHELS